MKNKKDERLRRIYKITEKEQKRSIEEQGGGCAICWRKFLEFACFQDHDHRCCDIRGKNKKKIFCGRCTRGQLCYICNKFVIGYVERQKIDINKVAAYLNKWNKILRERGVGLEISETI